MSRPSVIQSQYLFRWPRSPCYRQKRSPHHRVATTPATFRCWHWRSSATRAIVRRSIRRRNVRCLRLCPAPVAVARWSRQASVARTARAPMTRAAVRRSAAVIRTGGPSERISCGAIPPVPSPAAVCRRPMSTISSRRAMAARGSIPATAVRSAIRTIVRAARDQVRRRGRMAS